MQIITFSNNYFYQVLKEKDSSLSNIYFNGNSSSNHSMFSNHAVIKVEVTAPNQLISYFLNSTKSNAKIVDNHVYNETKMKFTAGVKTNQINSILPKCPKTPPNLQVRCIRKCQY